MVSFSLKKFLYVTIFILVFLSPFYMNLTYNVITSGANKNSEEIRISDGNLSIDLSILPEIDYTSLNDLWYDPKIEMLIITPPRIDYINAVEPLKNWKNEKGVKTVILSNFSLYEGVDDAEKIRNMIKSYYETENVRWVLLVGDTGNGANELPIRYVYNPDTIRVKGVSETVGDDEYKPTDYYYADLTGTWDSDGDGNWGEAPHDNDYGLDEISWRPNVYVGRFPADNALELEVMVNKTLKYETNPEIGDWMNRMLLAGGISNTIVQIPPDGEDESILTTYIWQNYVVSEMNFTHLWRSTYYTPPDPKEPLTSTNFKNQMNLGYSTVIFAGHGDPYVYADASGIIYTNIDANNILNTNKLSLIYGDACSTSSYDANDNSIGEYLIKKQDAGAIGYVGSLRINYYYPDDITLGAVNRGNAKLFWKEFFVNKKFQQGRALYDSKMSYINSDYYKTGIEIGNKIIQGSTSLDSERKQLLTYCLLGDPEVDIYTNIPKPVLNPFTENIYEGQLVSITIKDINNKIVPYARVHIRSFDGKYFTSYADEQGLASFRLPVQANEFYNVTITGHNLIKSHFNFTTLPDNNKPQLLGVEYNPKYPSTADNIFFTIHSLDNYSGVESAYIFLSRNNFTSYSYYGSFNNYEENTEIFTIDTDKLTPGEYSYIIVSRDYANNTIVFHDTTFRFSIPAPLMDYIFIISIILIFGVVGISVFILYSGFKKFTRVVKEI
ncbi:MAG: C25 family cysteine peptidase [Promethearchaeota archaeon]